MLTPNEVQQLALDAIIGQSMRSARTVQQEEHRIGASEIGMCRSYLKHMTIETPYDDDRKDDIKWAAFVGSAIGDRFEAAYLEQYPNAITQASLACTLPSGKVINCNPDLIDPGRNLLIDEKTKDGLKVIEREGKPSRQYQYQVAIYRLAAIQAGLLTEDCQTFLVYFDRAGKQDTPFALEVHCDEFLYDEIDQWIDDALYAVTNNVEAPKDQEYAFCEGYCPFFTSCRGGDSFVEGLIENEEVKTAMQLRLEAAADRKEAQARYDDANKVLREIAEQGGGRVMTEQGIYELSTTWVNGSSVSFEKAGYDRLNVRKQKPQRKKESTS